KYNSPYCLEIAMISGVFASARALRLRLPFGSLASRLTSATSDSGLGQRQTFFQLRVVKGRKCFKTIGDVEMSVQQMRARSLARKILDPRSRELLHHHVRNIGKRRRDAGYDIKCAGTAVEQYERGQFRHVVNEHVITPLLPLAKDQNWLALRGLPAKTVWSIAVVRVGSAINERRAQ